jgi:hypothetical protein
MKIKALLACFAALSASAQGLAQVPAPAEPQFSADAFRAHVAFLSDDLLEGRQTGSRGYDVAARYVATQFEALGLRPGGPEGRWLQPIEFLRYQNSGTPTLAIGGRTYSHGREILMRPNPAPGAYAVEAPMIFAGYGLDAPGHGFQDYARIDVRGKIVVVLDGYPAGTPSDVGAHLESEKGRMAHDHGALGMIVIRTRADAARVPWARMARFGGRPRHTFVEPDGQPSPRTGLGFLASVNEEVAVTLFEGSGHSLETIQDAIAADATHHPRGFALRPTARVSRDGEGTRYHSANVLAVLPGSDPALAGEYVLMMAHLDHLGLREPRPDDAADADRINNGAMDNATGVATLIEAARQMVRDGNRPRRPILFAAVTGEEIGLLGAEYLARHLPLEGRIVSVVNLDMPILTYDFQDVIAFGAEHSTMGAAVERAAARMGVRLIPDPLPEEGLFTRSDHYEFVRLGVPSVFLMTGFGGEGRARFTHFLENEYHSPRDDLTQAFHWQAGARFAQLNYLIAREIADAPSAPLWYADSIFRGERPGAARPATSRVR